MDKLKAALRAVLVYLAKNPGATTIVLGWVVLAAAKVGLNVSVEQLTALFAVMVPILTGVHVAARRGRRSVAYRGATQPAETTSNPAKGA